MKRVVIWKVIKNLFFMEVMILSLKSFLESRDVRNKFKQEFNKPKLRMRGELLAPPLTKRYGLVGTAFDYLLRFYIKRLNPNAIETVWISERSVRILSMEFQKMIIKCAKKIYSEFIKSGEMSDDLFEIVILLAQLDIIFRTGIVDENLGTVDKKDIKDLKNLISLVKPEYFTASKVCILNPTFGIASKLVGGADCDLVIDDAIIEIKTVKDLEFSRDYFNQLMGYYTLYKIGGIDGMKKRAKINRLGIYYSRYAKLYYINLYDIINPRTFPGFIKWFRDKATERHKLHL